MPRIYNYHEPGEEEEEEEKKVDPTEYEVVQKGMEECDPEAPASVFISKIIPFKQGTMAFGRVFSGTLKTGDSVTIYTHAGDKGRVKSITSVGVCMGAKFESVPSMPCGNTVVIGGVD